MTRPTTTESTCTRDAYSATHNWTNQYGDWRDSTGTQQGSSAWSGASVTVSATGLVTIDVTNIVKAAGADWFGNADRVCALLLKSVTAGSANFTANENATSGNRPKIKYIGGTNTGAFQDVNVATFFNTATSSPLGSVDPMELAGSGTGLEKRIFIECPSPVDVVTTATLQLNCTFTSGSPVITAWQVDAGDVWTSAPPNAPTDLVFTSVTATSMTVTVTPSGSGGSATSFKLYKRVQGAGSWDAPITQAGTAFAVSGLTGNTVYEFYAVASNTGGDSAAGATETQGTLNPATGGGGDLSGSGGGGGGGSGPVTSIEVTAASGTVGTPIIITVVNQAGVAVDGATIYAPIGLDSVVLGRTNSSGVLSWTPTVVGTYLLTAQYGVLLDTVILSVSPAPYVLPAPVVVTVDPTIEDPMNRRYAGDATLAFTFQLLNSSNAPVTGLTPLVLISKNGAAFAAHTGTVTEVGSGIYSYKPSVADVATPGPFYISASGGTAVPLIQQWDLLQPIQSPASRSL